MWREKRVRNEHRAMEGVNSHSKYNEVFPAFKAISSEDVSLSLWLFPQLRGSTIPFPDTTEGMLRNLV